MSDAGIAMLVSGVVVIQVVKPQVRVDSGVLYTIILLYR